MAVQVYGSVEPLASGRGQRFEYVRVQTREDNVAGADGVLSELGQAGWELVSAVYTTTFVHFWLKRPQGQ